MMLPYSLKHLKPEARQHILWLHQEAFDLPKEEIPCIPCKGRCCRGCASAKGYLLEEEFNKHKDLFDEKRGFLTDTGCSLPVEERSLICLRYVCYGYDSHHPHFGEKEPDLSAERVQIPFPPTTISATFDMTAIMYDEKNWIDERRDRGASDVGNTNKT